MALQFQSRRVEDTCNMLLKEFSCSEIVPDNETQHLTWDRISHRRRLEIRARGVAELTIQDHGATYMDQESVSKSPVGKMVVYVGGVNSVYDILIIGRSVDSETGNLVAPTGLHLQDLIGYRTIEQIAKR